MPRKPVGSRRNAAQKMSGVGRKTEAKIVRSLGFGEKGPKWRGSGETHRNVSGVRSWGPPFTSLKTYQN